MATVFATSRMPINSFSGVSITRRSTCSVRGIAVGSHSRRPSTRTNASTNDSSPSRISACKAISQDLSFDMESSYDTFAILSYDEANSSGSTLQAADYVTPNVSDTIPSFKKIYSWFVRPVVMVLLYPMLTAQNLGLPIATALDPFFLTAIASTVYGVYAFDRVKDVDSNVEDRINDPNRTSWIQRHRDTLWASIYATFGTACACMLNMTAPQQLLMSILMFLGFSYSTPFLPGGHSLRTAPAGKTITHALFYVLAVVGMPLASPMIGMAASFNPLMVAAMVGHAVVTCTDSLFNDLRDIAGDAESGTMSIPVMIGRDNTLMYVKSLTVVEGVFKLAVLHNPLLLIVNAMLFARAARLEQMDRSPKSLARHSYLDDQFTFQVTLAIITVGQLLAASSIFML